MENKSFFKAVDIARSIAAVEPPPVKNDDAKPTTIALDIVARQADPSLRSPESKIGDGDKKELTPQEVQYQMTKFNY